MLVMPFTPGCEIDKIKLLFVQSTVSFPVISTRYNYHACPTSGIVIHLFLFHFLFSFPDHHFLLVVKSCRPWPLSLRNCALSVFALHLLQHFGDLQCNLVQVKRSYVLGYVNGILAIGSSPRYLLIDGTVKTRIGPAQPTTML